MAPPKLRIDTAVFHGLISPEINPSHRTTSVVKLNEQDQWNSMARSGVSLAQDTYSHSEELRRYRFPRREISYTRGLGSDSQAAVSRTNTTSDLESSEDDFDYEQSLSFACAGIDDDPFSEDEELEETAMVDDINSPTDSIPLRTPADPHFPDVTDIHTESIPSFAKERMAWDIREDVDSLVSYNAALRAKSNRGTFGYGLGWLDDRLQVPSDVDLRSQTPPTSFNGDLFTAATSTPAPRRARDQPLNDDDELNSEVSMVLDSLRVSRHGLQAVNLGTSDPEVHQNGTPPSGSSLGSLVGSPICDPLEGEHIVLPPRLQARQREDSNLPPIDIVPRAQDLQRRLFGTTAADLVAKSPTATFGNAYSRVDQDIMSSYPLPGNRRMGHASVDPGVLPDCGLGLWSRAAQHSSGGHTLGVHKAMERQPSPLDLLEHSISKMNVLVHNQSMSADSKTKDITPIVSTTSLGSKLQAPLPIVNTPSLPFPPGPSPPAATQLTPLLHTTFTSPVPSTPGSSMRYFDTPILSGPLEGFSTPPPMPAAREECRDGNHGRDGGGGERSPSAPGVSSFLHLTPQNDLPTPAVQRPTKQVKKLWAMASRVVGGRQRSKTAGGAL
jgi:hypothetical protein